MRAFSFVSRLALLAPGLCVAAIPAQGDPPAPAPETAPAEVSAGSTLELPGIRKLTIGGQYRLRYENQQNFDFNDDAGASNDFFGQRVRLNFGLEFNDRISAFVQVQDVRNWGEEVSTTDDSADGFDLHQGWVQVGDVPGIGGTARVGRQVISFGAQRLIGGLDWANQGRSFDGVLQTWEVGDENLLVRAFFLDIGETINAVHDDVYVMGAYTTRQLGEDGNADLYLIWLHDNGAGAGQVHNRGTLGGRGLIHLDGLELEGEVATQFGEQGAADIPFGETYAAHAHGKYTLEGEAAAWLQLEVNAASGDDPASTDNERFNNLFPTGHMHWGMMDFASWSNLLHLMAQVGFVPCERTKASLAWSLFRSMEETDAFRGPNATLSAGAAAGSSKEMGHELDLLLHHDFGTERVQTSVQIGYGLFVPGDGVQDALGTDDLAHFLYVMGDFRF